MQEAAQTRCLQPELRYVESFFFILIHIHINLHRNVVILRRNVEMSANTQPTARTDVCRILFFIFIHIHTKLQDIRRNKKRSMDMPRLIAFYTFCVIWYEYVRIKKCTYMPYARRKGR